MTQAKAKPPLKRLRTRVGLAVVVGGLLIFALGAKPQLFGLDRSPVIGFIQIAVFLIGLGVICVGGYMTLAALWNGGPKTIASDIGQRLVSTGFVIAVACGMADIFGFGSEVSPGIPTFGIYQTIGVLIGEIVIGAGFLLLIPFQKTTSSESMLLPEHRSR
jgi:hypothetical protein